MDNRTNMEPINRHAKKSRNLSLPILTLIAIALCASAIVAMRNSQTGNYASRAASLSTNCTQTDQFLCDSLARLNQNDFLSQIYGGTITSFDGSAKVERTWSQDASGNTDFQVVTNGIESNRNLRVNSVRYTKDENTGEYKLQTEAEKDVALMIEQVGIEEDLGHFFGEDPNLNNYTFERIEASTCESQPCEKYQAHDKLRPDETNNKEYLFFDSTNHNLLKYQRTTPDYQSEYTFKFGTPPAIVLPTMP